MAQERPLPASYVRIATGWYNAQAAHIRMPHSMQHEAHTA